MPIDIGIEEARADHQIGAPAAQDIEKHLDFVGIVLPIAIQPDHIVIALVAGGNFSPVCTAPPIPKLKGCSTTNAPAASASCAVLSIEPSLMTNTSAWGTACRTPCTTWLIAPCSIGKVDDDQEPV